MENPVIIAGANAIGKAALEIFNSNNVIVYGFLDDDEKLHGTLINEMTVFGSLEDETYSKLIGSKCDVFVATDEISVRKYATDTIVEENKAMPVNAIHNKAHIAETAHIGHGNFFNAGSVINANTKIGNHCLIHSGAIIDISAEIGNFVHIGTGSNISASAIIEDEVFIGAGVTVVGGIKVGKGARLGAGSIVIADVPEGATVFGNPAKEV
ncbi:NeuD/PglB/VioB family sugar acetyltransferase [Aureibacter tunicatorum]|uniref:Sugar O-acyltransferase (Sialic acid O-acetyltransferase NeuD family) n=1 Tax=Aureibacter tunicatorum TaxID=866807 RepID=A0AAE3XLX3_9BACT|nr:NeuD/PglB/VioB family sugar acetyltransferase [Aureibacter tunicatorum]MDR6238852.1 sugar O-acyltransferase (sialic acid O-acetyltransferase NeuD family) [Aureibacter tunicatorum]BDD05221.1 transferase [Aureibacter tunicatorum]